MKELEDMRNDELFTTVVVGIQILRDNERKQGYADGKADTPFTDTEEAEKKAYEKGLNDAWECAKKLCQSAMYGGSEEYCREIFELTPFEIVDVFDYSASQCIEKVKAYEERQKQTEDEIKVGYEVYNLDPENKRIVTAIDGNKAIQLCSNGKYTVDNIDTLHWTGREDLRIKKVLEKITNEI